MLVVLLCAGPARVQELITEADTKSKSIQNKFEMKMNKVGVSFVM
jgi:hypothetical protein